MDEYRTEAVPGQRRAQFLLDFVEAENSTGFHAPQEAARILGLSLDYSRRGQAAVRDAVKNPLTPARSESLSELPPPAPTKPLRWELTYVPRDTRGIDQTTKRFSSRASDSR